MYQFPNHQLGLNSTKSTAELYKHNFDKALGMLKVLIDIVNQC